MKKKQKNKNKKTNVPQTDGMTVFVKACTQDGIGRTGESHCIWSQ